MKFLGVSNPSLEDSEHLTLVIWCRLNSSDYSYSLSYFSWRFGRRRQNRLIVWREMSVVSRRRSGHHVTRVPRVPWMTWMTRVSWMSRMSRMSGVSWVWRHAHDRCWYHGVWGGRSPHHRHGVWGGLRHSSLGCSGRP